jgi:hypothetical protein
MRRIPVLTLMTILSVGCGTTIRFIPTSGAHLTLKRVQKKPEEVEVFTSGLPTRPFVELGMVEGEQASTLSLHSRARVFNEMRTWAANMGCDGAHADRGRRHGLPRALRRANARVPRDVHRLAQCAASAARSAAGGAQVAGHGRRGPAAVNQVCLTPSSSWAPSRFTPADISPIFLTRALVAGARSLACSLLTSRPPHVSARAGKGLGNEERSPVDPRDVGLSSRRRVWRRGGP